MCCIVLCCYLLCCIVMCCIVLYYIVLYSIILYCIVLYCNVLCCIVLSSFFPLRPVLIMFLCYWYYLICRTHLAYSFFENIVLSSSKTTSFFFVINSPFIKYLAKIVVLLLSESYPSLPLFHPLRPALSLFFIFSSFNFLLFLPIFHASLSLFFIFSSSYFSYYFSSFHFPTVFLPMFSKISSPSGRS